MPAGDLIGMDYRGDAGQGLGSNAGITAPDPNPELKHVNEAIKNIMLLDSERNIKLFSQKVQDRDNLTQRILSNQVSTGEIDPKDQPMFDKAKGDVEEAFKSWAGNWNDTDGYRKYQEAVTHLQDTGTHAQTRWAMMKQLEAQKAQETLPHKQQQIQSFIDKESKKPFWNQINPYQQLFSYDHERMQNSLLGGGMSTEGGGGIPEFGQPKPVTEKETTKTTGGKTTVTDTRTTAPAKATTAKGTAGALPGSVPDADGLPPIFSTTKKYWDYDVMQKRAATLQVENGVDAENQNQWLNLVEGYDEAGKKKMINAMNDRIGQYNAQRGFVAGQKGFVSPVQLVPDPETGKTKIKEPAADFAAKTILSGIDGNYTASEYRFDKDAAKYRIDLDKNKIAKGGLGVKWFDAHTKRMAVGLKARQLKGLDDDAKQISQIWDNIGANIDIPDIPVTNFGSTTATSKFKVNVEDLPEGFTYMQGLNAKGQPIQLIGKDATPVYGGKNGKEVTGYKGGYFNADYFVPAGTKIGNKTVDKDIQLTSRELFDIYQKSGGSGSFKDFIIGQFKDGKLDYQLEGANGKANRVSSYISQKAMSNKLTKKGQESPYEQDELDLIGIQPTDSDTPQDNN